jgi:acyl-CoA synthetase (AMP-forming)/AMP-acid ligase II
VAVIGVADERLGEVGKAFIMKKPGVQLTEGEVIDWAREHMANFKVPRFVDFIDAFPLNASGKVLKTELRKRGQ